MVPLLKAGGRRFTLQLFGKPEPREALLSLDHEKPNIGKPAIMKQFRLALLAIAPLLGSCAGTPSQSAELEFEFTTTDQPPQEVFELVLRSRDSRAICMDVQDWPQGGSVHYGAPAVRIVHDAGAVPIKDSNFGFCPEGCGVVRVEPRGRIVAHIPYSEFAAPIEEIREMKNRRLEFPIRAYACKGKDRGRKA
jgi:hypothetical protein